MFLVYLVYVVFLVWNVFFCCRIVFVFFLGFIESFFRKKEDYDCFVGIRFF